MGNAKLSAFEVALVAAGEQRGVATRSFLVNADRIYVGVHRFPGEEQLGTLGPIVKAACIQWGAAVGALPVQIQADVEQ